MNSDPAADWLGSSESIGSMDQLRGNVDVTGGMAGVLDDHVLSEGQEPGQVFGRRGRLGIKAIRALFRY